MPRSVMRPVTSRAGVTSKAGFRAGLPGATTATVSIAPPSVRPVICVTSRAERSSIGISRTPSRSDQSMVENGSAA